MDTKTFRRMMENKRSQPPEPPPSELVIGHPDFADEFAQSHSVLVDALPRVWELASVVLGRTLNSDKPNDRIVFSFGNLAMEDFEEILVLGFNGYGFGCQKILRGMFERVVTASHLHRHPEDTDRFINFHHISDYKLVREIFDSLGEYAGITKELVEERKQAKDAVKDEFVRDCSTKGCDKKIPAFSWTNLDLVSMAKQDKDLKDIVGLVYYVPMAHTHATVQSMLSHMSKESAGFGNAVAKGREWAHRAVCAGHALILKCFDTQFEHFPELKDKHLEQLEQCRKDFIAAWGDPKKTKPAT